MTWKVQAVSCVVRRLVDRMRPGEPDDVKNEHAERRAGERGPERSGARPLLQLVTRCAGRCGGRHGKLLIESGFAFIDQREKRCKAASTAGAVDRYTARSLPHDAHDRIPLERQPAAPRASLG